MSSRRPGAGGDALQAAALWLLACVALSVGWRQLWFLTDDAFIAFRYVSNSLLGLGYVWNAAPFAPVEGYTSFLWVVLLDLVWRLTGVAPPQSANLLSFGCSMATMALTARIVWSLRWRRELLRWRLPLLGLVLLGLVTHRTFVTWTSSGLETALYNLLVIAWVWAIAIRNPRARNYAFVVSLAAAAAYLARPDGLLIAMATIALLVADAWLDSGNRRSIALGALPLLAVPLHLLWRHAFYGLWLPNTYYAKVTGIWPESGLRYLASFALEYALWFWPLVAIGLLITGRVPSISVDRRVLLAASVLLAQVGYYIVFVGGDHFEYRVLSHVVPLILISFLWLLNRSTLRPTLVLSALALFVALSWPVPWTHHAATRSLTTRSETFRMTVPIAGHFPPGLRWYARTFDGLQAWLIRHFVGVRHQEHKVNLQFVRGLFPVRTQGARIPADGYPVIGFPAAGYVAWSLPHVNVIDLHGLNDRVIAHLPPERSGLRMMAHERRVPPEYLACFRPDWRFDRQRGLHAAPRREPLTAETIRDCERQWWDRVRTRSNPSESRLQLPRGVPVRKLVLASRSQPG